VVVIDKGMLALQDYMDLEKGVPVQYGETSLTSRDSNHAMNIKVEEDSDVKVDDDPVPITFPKIKAEPEVSCMHIHMR
jgi:hypothetical protein